MEMLEIDIDMFRWSFVNLVSCCFYKIHKKKSIFEWTIPKQNLKTENKHWKCNKFSENIDKIQL